ncbi:MAG: hypothetical protein LAO06_06620 [Acidobacteriia bacterium]|nr:hypothetical protein [Terriglobia bacterium]
MRRVVLFFCLVLCGSTSRAADQPQLSADIGPCWVEFTVTDAAKKPVYLAKIHTIIRYGFLSKRKTELELSTDADGKGKFAGLPQEVKKPIEFTVSYKGQSKTVTHDPGTNCHQTMEVELGSK